MHYLFISFLLIGLHQMSVSAQSTLEAFAPNQTLNWRIVNDGVMGGISSSKMEVLPNATGKFSGRVSLENYGGFASTRARLIKALKTKYTKVLMKVKGDGKKYSFRIRTDANFDGVSYKNDFITKKDEWQEIELRLANFIPTWRGRQLRDIPPIVATQIRQIGILISDKQEGTFELLVDWIKLQ